MTPNPSSGPSQLPKSSPNYRESV